MTTLKIQFLTANEQGTWILNKKSKPCIRALKTEFTQKIHEAGVMEMTDMGRKFKISTLEEI